MTQLNFSADAPVRRIGEASNSLSLSRQNFTHGHGTTELPILTVLKDTYLLWHNFLIYMPRLSRQSLGVRIDDLFIEILEKSLTAKYAKRENKKLFLEELSRKLDNLKFFVTLLWEAKGLDASKYAQLSQKLTTTGRMLGKWLQSMPNQNS